MCTSLIMIRRNYLFWMDTNGINRLYRSLLNGSQVTTLVTSDIGCSGWHYVYIHSVLISVHMYAEGLAWDWVGEKLYWTDNCHDEIEVYDPITTHRKVLLTTGSYPYAIKVDPSTG